MQKKSVIIYPDLRPCKLVEAIQEQDLTENIITNIEAGKRTTNEIFNGDRILEIPFFQRAYVWGDEQLERLLEDMEHFSQTSKPYYLGQLAVSG